MVSNVLVVVKVVELPEQIEVAPAMVGVVGKGVKVTAIALLAAEVQPVTVFLILNEKVPGGVRVSELPDEELLHK